MTKVKNNDDDDETITVNNRGEERILFKIK